MKLLYLSRGLTLSYNQARLMIHSLQQAGLLQPAKRKTYSKLQTWERTAGCKMHPFLAKRAHKAMT